MSVYPSTQGTLSSKMPPPSVKPAIEFPAMVRTLSGEFRLVEAAEPVPRPATFCDAMALARFQDSLDHRTVHDPRSPCVALGVWRDGGFWFVAGLQSPTPHVEL